MDYKVHIAYGFHVNCYHSYRGDTNDKQGFGGDIRIIRQIIKVLNDFNKNGVPAKATWDFENAYSIEDILPKYAPDILSDIKERVEKYGDENIIMGYNNGALSAMNEDELSASINWAVTNKHGSGLKDVFGECEMIVRPQEVMFSPSQVSVYNKLGVKALCLYYSCVPFDAFRTFIPQLSDEFAFNPVSYKYKGESLTIMPTYNNSDLIDAGSLRYLACDLHKQQKEGKINNDVLIFVNMDADAIFWEPVLKPPFNKIANTDGIHGLVKEVADLDFVEFNTVGGYLNNHKPLKEIEFTEDTADGGFSGYSSWSEKPFNCQIWTRLERARAFAKLAKSDSLSPSFEDRVMLLSTTHFGLASPVLNIEREKKALEMSERMVDSEISNLKNTEEFTLYNISGSALTSVEISLKDGFISSIEKLYVNGKNLKNYVCVPIDYYESGCVKTAMLIAQFKSVNKKETLDFSNTGKAKNTDNTLTLKSNDLEMRFCVHGKVLKVKHGEKTIGDDKFIQSFVNYNGMRYYFENTKAMPLKIAGDGKAIKVTGEIHLPTELESGSFEYIFYTIGKNNGIFVATHIKYPYTKEETEISTESTALGRKSDVKWLEAVPLQLSPRLYDVFVVKRNYMDDISSYKASDFKKVIPENNNIDSFNHHLTNGFIAVSDGETGLLFANSKQVLNSMAHCPMRLRETEGKQKVMLNPFGTYYGKQRVYPSRSNGGTAESFLVVSPQSRSIAPAYNGVEQWFSGALFAYDGLEPQEEILNEIIGFSEGSALSNGKDKNVMPFSSDNVSFKAIEKNVISDKQLKSVIVSGAKKDKFDMLKTGAKVFSNILISQIKTRKE